MGRRKALLLVPVVLYVTRPGYQSLSPETKRAASRLVNRLFEAAERRGLVERSPGFRRDYLRDYPELEILERNYDAIRRECVALLEMKDRLTDVEALGGSYTSGGIHTIRWKSVVFKSGKFIEENCALCPETASMMRRIPGVYTTFFSILDPHQYVRPHLGYYKGFLRYHLGVLIPRNNGDSRFPAGQRRPAGQRAPRSVADRARREVLLAREQGVMFDDTFLHDAINDSDEVRVVLGLDIARRMSRPFDLINRGALWIAFRDPSVTQVRRNAVVSVAPAPLTARTGSIG